jgi:hypothetical protein
MEDEDRSFMSLPVAGSSWPLTGFLGYQNAAVTRSHRFDYPHGGLSEFGVNQTPC